MRTLLLAMMLVSCATPSPRRDPVFAARQSLPAKVMPGARYQIAVGADQQLSGEYRVASDGSIDFPLCGSLKVLGAQELEAQLTKCLLPSLRAPAVTVRLVDSGQVVTLLGDLAQPVRWQEGLTLISLLMQAGGEGLGGELVRVQVLRGEHSATVNVNEIAKGNEADLALEPGDVVRVECRSGSGCGGRQRAAAPMTTSATARALISSSPELQRAVDEAVQLTGLEVKLQSSGAQTSLDVTAATPREAQARCNVLVLAIQASLANSPSRKWLQSELIKTRETLRTLEISRREVPFDAVCAQDAGLEVCAKTQLIELDLISPARSCEKGTLCTIGAKWREQELEVQQLSMRYGPAHPTLAAAVSRGAELASWFERQKVAERAALKGLLARLATADRKRPASVRKARLESVLERLLNPKLELGAMADDLPLPLRLASSDYNALLIERNLLLLRYSEQHPRIIAMEARLAALQVEALRLAQLEAAWMQKSLESTAPQQDPRVGESARQRENLLHVLELLDRKDAAQELNVLQRCASK